MISKVSEWLIQRVSPDHDCNGFIGLYRCLLSSRVDKGPKRERERLATRALRENRERLAKFLDGQGSEER